MMERDENGFQHQMLNFVSEWSFLRKSDPNGFVPIIDIIILIEKYNLVDFFDEAMRPVEPIEVESQFSQSRTQSTSDDKEPTFNENSSLDDSRTPSDMCQPKKLTSSDTKVKIVELSANALKPSQPTFEELGDEELAGVNYNFDDLKAQLEANYELFHGEPNPFDPEEDDLAAEDTVPRSVGEKVHPEISAQETIYNV